MEIQTTLKAQPPHYRNRLVDYDLFFLIVLNRGTLYFESARESVAIRPGGMAVLRRGSRFTLHTEDDGYDAVGIVVTPTDVAPFQGESVALGATPEMSGLLSWLISELTLPGPHSEPLVDALGRCMLHYALRRLDEHLPGEPQEARQRFWAARVASAIAGSLYTDRNIEQILSALEPSHRQIARYMQVEFGRSPKQYQMDLKIREACQLLENTRLSVTTIAMELGFPSVQHFSSQFRRVTGAPPSRWKARSRSSA